MKDLFKDFEDAFALGGTAALAGEPEDANPYVDALHGSASDCDADSVLKAKAWWRGWEAEDERRRLRRWTESLAPGGLRADSSESPNSERRAP